MTFGSSNALIACSCRCLDPLTAISQRPRARGIPRPLRQQSHLQEALVMIGFQVEGLAITVHGAGLSACVAHQAEQVMCFRAIAMVLEVRFTKPGGFLEPAGV